MLRRGVVGVGALSLAAILLSAQAPAPRPAQIPSVAGVAFERAVTPFSVLRPDGSPVALPFVGGLDVPRPQFVDIDGDGDLDLFLQEYSNQLWHFENTGSARSPHYIWRTDRFQNLEIGEWYRFVDLDADGLLDLLTESPISRIRHYRNTGTASLPVLTLVGELKDASGASLFMDRQNIPAIGDLDCDKRLDMLVGRVEGVVDRYEATAPGAASFALIAERYEGIEIIGGGGSGIGMPSARHGANAIALQDFDGDVDLDLFWGDFFEPAVLLIENIGRTCSSPSFQVEPVTLPFAKDTRTSGYNAPAPVDIDGDGDMDFLLGVIGGAFNPIKTLEDNFLFWERTAKDAFELRSRRYLDGIDLGSDAAPAAADIDADGDLDLIVGAKIDARTNGPGPLYLFRNTGTASAPRYQMEAPIPVGDAFNLMPAVGDLDADGDIDLIVGTWNKDLLYVRNEGTARTPFWVVDDAMTITPPRVSHAAPALVDLDADGDLDLLIGHASGYVAFYRNTGTRQRPRFTLVSEKLDDMRSGRRATPAAADVDGDGLIDLVLGHEEAGLPVVYRNAGTKRSPKFVPHAPLQIPLPPASALVFADLTGDRIADLLVGTTSGGLRFYAGTRMARVPVRPRVVTRGQ